MLKESPVAGPRAHMEPECKSQLHVTTNVVSLSAKVLTAHRKSN